MCSIIVADPHPVTRRGIVELLRSAGHKVVETTDNGADATDAVARLRPDMLLMDVALSNSFGLDALRGLQAAGGSTPVVLLSSAMTDEQLAAAEELRIPGLLLKSCPEEIVLRCIDEVAHGRRWIDRTLANRMIAQNQHGENGAPADQLTRKEHAIAQLAASGKPNRYIADELGVAEGTVKVHLHNIFRKLAVKNRTELARLLA